MSEKFNYVVGRPWDASKPDGSVGAYSYGGQVFYGTIEDAEDFRQYCDAQLTHHERVANGYRIYKLSEISK